MSLEYGFSQEQNTYLDEMLSDRFRSLWSSLMGGYSAGMGIIPSEATWIGLNGFIWPLPINGTISSGYVYRSDPFTGEQKFHGGLDIAAAEGTPIVAAESGVVTIANGSDLWGGGYGYYVKIDHLNGYETLYGHCSFICVTEGQSVRKGEVIAYVGSTGNSTGDHLHFETYLYGERHDPMGIYTRT
ncbi:MAG: M23 family metallopeptidase [Oscillospiraceae bacterium]|nr:M23 family metallopeptidase [Oscillospiraceae bacterium]